MPRSVDLFICSPDPLDAVAEAIAGATGFTALPGQSGSWLVQDGDVGAVLGENGHADDDLPLSRYPYVISAEVPDGVRPQDSAPAALLRQVVQKLQGMPGWMTLMVLDMQYRGAEGDSAAGANVGTTVAAGTPADPEVPA